MRAYENIGSAAAEIIGDLHANYVIAARAAAAAATAPAGWRDELN